MRGLLPLVLLAFVVGCSRDDEKKEADECELEAEADAITVQVPQSNGPTEDLPDLTIDTALLDQSLQFYEIETIDTESAEFACAIAEGCLAAEGPRYRDVMRFSVGVANIGAVDLHVGDPKDSPEDFVFGACHQHYHYEGFASYQISDGCGAVAFGHKQAFCLMDYEDYGEDGPSPEGYDCIDQGISVGWMDIYHGYLDCQWVEVTGMKSGTYNLSVTVNAEHKIAESGPGVNTVTVPVTIP